MGPLVRAIRPRTLIFFYSTILVSCIPSNQVPEDPSLICRLQTLPQFPIYTPLSSKVGKRHLVHSPITYRRAWGLGQHSSGPAEEPGESNMQVTLASVTHEDRSFM